MEYIRYGAFITGKKNCDGIRVINPKTLECQCTVCSRRFYLSTPYQQIKKRENAACPHCDWKTLHSHVVISFSYKDEEGAFSYEVWGDERIYYISDETHPLHKWLAEQIKQERRFTRLAYIATIATRRERALE
ncbi:hypothetical protein [Leminorella grimontii]|nr:hypothetical protein [Leminorella grimontii]KFC93191.1 hypothetical protein GLGR_3463 [Leminorella grimontii ATCC 33999 = DSM 5078]